MTSSVTILGHQIECVKNFKCLGIILTDDMRLKSDICRALDAFLLQFNGVYSKFFYLDVSVPLFYTIHILPHSTEQIHGARLDQHEGLIRYPWRITKL